MGFYLNGCGCNEKRPLRINYEGDVRASIDWGFDGVKIDSCGAQKNMSLYYELFNNRRDPWRLRIATKARTLPTAAIRGRWALVGARTIPSAPLATL